MAHERFPTTNGAAFVDAHHLLFPKNEWLSRPQAKLLRGAHSLIPQLSRDTHNEIHRALPGVPLLSYHLLARTLRDYEPGDTTIESMDNLMFSMRDAARHPRAHHIERSVAELAIHAIELQKPFVIEALEG